jgi:ATP-dependent RNA helicase DDX49/DBP8
MAATRPTKRQKAEKLPSPIPNSDLESDLGSQTEEQEDISADEEEQDEDENEDEEDDEQDGSEGDEDEAEEGDEVEEEEEEEEEEEPEFKSTLSFGQLGLASWLVNALKAMSITAPSEIQTKCIPEILAGKDVIGGAKTGSGKTAAFALPILQKLSEDPYGVFAVILTPTRYCHASSVTHVICYRLPNSKINP